MNMSLQLFHTPFPAAWNSSPDKIFNSWDQFGLPTGDGTWKCKKWSSKCSTVAQLAQPFNPRLIIAEMCNISFLDILLGSLKKNPNFQFGEIFGSCFRPTCTKSWSLHVCHATILAKPHFAFLIWIYSKWWLRGNMCQFSSSSFQIKIGNCPQVMPCARCFYEVQPQSK